LLYPLWTIIHWTLLVRLSLYFFPFFFFLSCSADHRDLHSFPTRRSSDLPRCSSLQSCSSSSVTSAGAWASPSIRSTAPHRRRVRSEEHTSELQSRGHLVCRLLLEKKKSQ